MKRAFCLIFLLCSLPCLLTAQIGVYQQGQIDQDDLEDIIHDQKALAEMHALKNTGLASAAIDTFTNGVIQIMINAAFAALKI